MIAERTAADRYLSAFMSDQIGECFNGQISGVSRAGLFVGWMTRALMGWCPPSRLGAERFFVDDDKLSLVGGTTGTVFRIGQPVRPSHGGAPLQGRLLFLLRTMPVSRMQKGAKFAVALQHPGAACKQTSKKQPKNGPEKIKMTQLAPSTLSATRRKGRPCCAKPRQMPGLRQWRAVCTLFESGRSMRTCGLEFPVIRPMTHHLISQFSLSGTLSYPSRCVERTYQPPLIMRTAMFSVLSVIITLISLPMVKGAVVGLQWALRIRLCGHEHDIC